MFVFINLSGLKQVKMVSRSNVMMELIHVFIVLGHWLKTVSQNLRNSAINVKVVVKPLLTITLTMLIFLI